MLVIKNGSVFINGDITKKDILIEDGKISNISSSLDGTETIDASGKIVLPGLIDPHVHLREPGDIYKEDFITGSKAAIAGGFTTVMDMPNNKFPTITKQKLDEKIQLAKKAVCDILFHFGGTDDNFDEVKKADPQSLKLYLGETTGMLILKNQDSIEKHFNIFPKERPIVLHASDHSKDESVNLPKTYATVENASNLAKKTNRRIHLAHASTKKEIEIAKQYNNFTVEAAPHYLFLSSNDAKKLGVFGKVYPPLRSEKERSEIWQVLQKVDCIATDHAPHTKEDKENGCAGFPGLETSLALMLRGSDLGLIDRKWVFKSMSENPARLFNIQKKGRIEKGFIGDITILDPNKVWKVKGEETETKCKWSPFEGMELKGKVHSVIKSGNLIYHEYEFV
ncbi:MAG: dihydroorotase family protein [Candidatus Micrarchaeota archaeon]